MLPHEKRQRTFPKGIEESDDEVENMGETLLLPGPRRTVSLFDLRSVNMKFTEYPGFGRSVSTLFLTSPSVESCKPKSACSEEHLPRSRPSSDSPRLERRSPGVGSSREFPRPGPSTPDIGLSTETLWSGHSLSYAGPTSESLGPGPSLSYAGPTSKSLKPGPSSPHAASFSDSGLRPTSPPPLHRSLFVQYLNQELMKQQLTSRGKAFLKSSAYFGQGPINLIPPNQVPPNQGIVNQKPPQGSPNKEPFNQEYAHQVSSNLMPLNQTTQTQAPSQTQEQEVNTMTDVQNFTFGLSLDIICNHVQLDLIPGKGVFEYNIEFFPQENNQFLRNQMIRQQEEFLGDALFFSGEKLFLSTSSFEERYFECIHPTSDIRVKMVMKYKGPASDTDSEKNFNMIFRKIMIYLGMKNVGCEFFDPFASINLTHYGLEIWPGFATNVLQCDGGLQVCFNASNCVIHSKSVLELIYHIQQEKPNKFQEECSRLITGATIITRYNHKIYKVKYICWDKHPESSFTTNQENQITYLDTTPSQLQITVQDMGQPLLLAHAIKTINILNEDFEEELCINLIPELCYFIGLTKEMRMDRRLMRDITQRFQPSPTILHDGICKLLQKIDGNDMSKRLLNAWGLNVGVCPLRLESRVLNQETLWYKNARIDLAAGQARWSVDHQFLIKKDLKNWAILHLEDDKSLAQQLESNLRCVAGSFDMKMYPGRLLQVPENTTNSYLHILDSTIDPAIKLVIILVPSSQSERYAAVKRFCCIDKPLISQVVVTQTLSKTPKVEHITKNLVMQINCKLGGALWNVTIPYSKLMVCGINIFPDTSRKCLVMGFVASSDPLQLSWHSKVGFGASIKEFGDTLYLGMLNALKRYKEVSGVLPHRILVYRDELSDEEVKLIQEIDVPNFTKSFRDVAEKYRPKLTVIICQRKIMTRLMAVEDAWGLNIGMCNPMPGVVLDHTITRCDQYDFFLISQNDKFGTVSPTHYIVAYDSGDMSPDKLHKITYKMAHLYYNVPGLISIPAPVQYAHRLARLVGEHLHEEPSPALSDKLYFI